MADRVYTISGMTCGDCVSAVSREIGNLAGVDTVDVELSSGRVTVSGGGYTADQIRVAVEEAGHSLVET